MGDFLYSSSVLANESCVANPSLLDTLSINNLLNIKHLAGTSGSDIAGTGISDSLGTIGESSSSSSSVSMGERTKTNGNGGTGSKMSAGGGSPGSLSLGVATGGSNASVVDGPGGLLMASSVAASSCGVGGLSSVSSIITTAMSSDGCSLSSVSAARELSIALGSAAAGSVGEATVTSSLLNGGSITSPSIVNLGGHGGVNGMGNNTGNSSNGNHSSTGHNHSNNGGSSASSINSSGPLCVNGNGGGNQNSANNNLLLDGGTDQLQLQSVAEELSLKATDLGCLGVSSNLMNGSSHIGSCLAPSGLGFGTSPDHSSPWSTGPDETTSGQGSSGGAHLRSTSSIPFPNKSSLTISATGTVGGGVGGGSGVVGSGGSVGGIGSGGFPGPLDVVSGIDENRDPFLSSYQ
uniref:Uncharacterized protein n=1 Tax=Anopheles minimus TaxID=112268 RepID=A0A182W2L8_9DIPT